jgi:hypothetical protein
METLHWPSVLYVRNLKKAPSKFERRWSLRGELRTEILTLKKSNKSVWGPDHSSNEPCRLYSIYSMHIRLL